MAATVRRYYVATNGSDSNSGSKTRPWKTVYAAINKMTRGGILYVRGGTYSYSGENIIGARRTSTTRITVTNYPGETPVFKTTSTQAIFMWFRNAANITVQHLVVYGDPNSPTRVSHGGAIFQFTGNTSGIVLSGNKAYGGPRWANTQHGVYIGAGTVRDIHDQVEPVPRPGRRRRRVPLLPRPQRPADHRPEQHLLQVGHLRPGLVEHLGPLHPGQHHLDLPDRRPLPQLSRHRGHREPRPQQQPDDRARYPRVPQRVQELLELTLPSARGS